MSSLSSIVLSSRPWQITEQARTAFQRKQNVDLPRVPQPRERTVPECTHNERNARRLAYLLKYPEDDDQRELPALKSACKRKAALDKEREACDEYRESHRPDCSDETLGGRGPHATDHRCRKCREYDARRAAEAKE